MSLPAFLLLCVLQASESLPSVTVRCDLDTDIPLNEIRVSTEEKRELKLAPRRQGGVGSVTLQDLPEGDLHLVFFRGDQRLGTIELEAAREGDFIRLKVRLVEGNAILLDDYRIHGVSGIRPGGPRQEPEEPAPTVSAAPSPSPVSTSTPPSARDDSPPSCPAPGEALTLEGKLTRIIDHDSFEMRSGTRIYTVYIGDATRIHRGSRDLRRDDLTDQHTLVVRGTVAAGPVGECSVGAKSIEVKR